MKMKLEIIDKTGKKISEFDLNLTEDIREDIFKKAVLSENSLFRQAKGADPRAGKKQVINLSKRRKNFRTTYGRGGSRTPKKVMWSRGTQFRYVGAWVSQTVGGRRAHPPKAEKNTLRVMNNKEWLKALRSGFCASLNRDLVISNGQKLPNSYPFVLDSSVEEISKTKDVNTFLLNLGFTEELNRTQIRKVRAGRGTMRNRTYVVKRGPLFVVSSDDSPLLKALRNIKGFEVVTPDLLMASDFGMSDKIGRAVVFTNSALTEFMEVLN